MILAPAIHADPLLVTLSGKMAPLASMSLFLAPMPTVRQVVEQKTVGNLPLLPHTAMISTAFLWVTYGALTHEPSVWGSNGVGIMFSVYYFSQFLKYAPKEAVTLPGSIETHIQACVAAILSISGIALALPQDDAASLIGKLGVAFCMMLNASPLVAIKTVLETKSAESIPTSVTLASIACCFFWAIVGLEQMDDWVVYFPNLVGLCFGLAQLMLKIMYSETSSNDAAEREIELAICSAKES